MFGGGGQDTLYGGAGSDKMFGGGGNDTLHGGWGGDIIKGGKGKDTLTGNEGSDKFIFNSTSDSSHNFDTITDLEIGTDTIKGPSGTKYWVKNYSDSVSSFTESNLNSYFEGKNLKSKKAYTFTVDNGDTFLYINDSNKEFSYQDDAFIKITGYSGDISSLSIG